MKSRSSIHLYDFSIKKQSVPFSPLSLKIEPSPFLFFIWAWLNKPFEVLPVPYEPEQLRLHFV